MSKLLIPIYVIYKLWIGLIFWTTMIILYPAFWILLQRKRWFGPAFRLKRFWSRLFQMLLFTPVKPTFRATLPPPPYIIASNHSSYLDTVFAYSVFSDYFLFVGKEELLKWPLFGTFFRYQDIPVSRENSRAAWQSMEKAREAIQRGECIAIYPEGTVPPNSPRLGNFKNGAFRLAIQEQIPIVPVTWQTNYRIMFDPTAIFSPSLPRASRVVIHEAISTKGLDEADMSALRWNVFRTIESEIPAHYRRD
ncbi:MAG: 1-acyl-sn-glycerol-3-phosphate acyltransferase [Flavobacteriales bacterium]|nr:1-acyl-sn-glycerol-3-phosphate acyltransferase [Flavobacteriales bacterium]